MTYLVSKVSCSWCHTSNPAGKKFCRACGHRAALPRLACDCPQCRPQVTPSTEEGPSAPPGKEELAGN